LENLFQNKVIHGNVLDVIKTIPDNTADMIITSPPYWGLRDYNLPDTVFGNNYDCDHIWQEENHFLHRGSSVSKKLTAGVMNNEQASSNICSKCGAWKGQLGQEPDPRMYIDNLLEIFNECKRVVKDSGSVWVNLGDSYSANRSYQVDGTKQCQTSQPKVKQPQCKNYGIKPKSLIGIPDRFKIAMIDNGWICRNEIIWHKPNQMPSSAQDRFTVDFEKLYFFTKNEKYYFEQQLEESEWAKLDKRAETGATLGKKGSQGIYAQNESGKYRKDKMRNMRCVWSINTKPLKEAHFAVYPEQLIEVPIISCCPENGLVLDIFFGSGTTGVVAKKLKRNYLGIDLNLSYIEDIAIKRIEKATT